MKENSLTLHLYCTKTNRLLVSNSFAHGVGIPQPEGLGVRSFPCLIIFNSSSPPKYVLKGYFNIRSDKLICCKEKRGLCCGQLWIIDIENETGISQFLPDFGRIEFMRETETVVAVTGEGWLQSKELGKMRLEPGNENGLFLGGVDPWVLEGWKKLAYIPPRFAPCHESGIVFNPRGEVVYVCESGKELVRVYFKW